MSDDPNDGKRHSRRFWSYMIDNEKNNRGYERMALKSRTWAVPRLYMSTFLSQLA